MDTSSMRNTGRGKRVPGAALPRINTEKVPLSWGQKPLIKAKTEMMDKRKAKSSDLKFPTLFGCGDQQKHTHTA